MKRPKETHGNRRIDKEINTAAAFHMQLPCKLFAPLLSCQDCGSQVSGLRKGSERIAYRKVEGKAIAETL